ncbi:O-antigen ligase family protein [Clostridium sp.]|uniref:O-antigen ligase family protein n=1 Tax=Clostridium sp. TaxID=1506 RepID=UPI00290F957B|nr:O-antigen ligase family protein [Clostridium sp.]MDU7242249.1 O-antigen ligase family protein [Clostridium sp.]
MTKLNNISTNFIISVFIILIPFFWVIGLKFLFLQLLAFILLALNIKEIKKSDKLLKISFGFILIYAISNIIAIINNPMNFALSDFVGSIYGCSYWTSGILIICSIVNSNDKNINIIIKGICILAIVQIIVFIMSIAKWNEGSGSISSMAILYNYLPNALKENNFFKSVMTINITVKDYLSTGVAYRFNGFYTYPVATALGSLYLLVYTYLFDCSSTEKYRKIFVSIIKYALIFILVLCIYYSRSRAVFLLIPIALFSTVILYYFNKNNAKYIIGIVIVTIMIGVIILLKTDIIDKILLSRAGSSSERLNSYKYAFQVIKENPFFGIGDKFKAEGIFVLIGSHSTIIGTLVKAGVVGLIGIIGFLITVIVKIFDNKKYINNNFSKKIWISTTFLFLSNIIWMITEDIDWPQIVAFLFFLNISIIFSFKKLTDIN